MFLPQGQLSYGRICNAHVQRMYVLFHEALDIDIVSFGVGPSPNGMSKDGACFKHLNRMSSSENW